MSRSRKRPLQSKPADIVQNGVTIVSVVEPEPAQGTTEMADEMLPVATDRQEVVERVRDLGEQRQELLDQLDPLLEAADMEGLTQVINQVAQIEGQAFTLTAPEVVMSPTAMQTDMPDLSQRVERAIPDGESTDAVDLLSDLAKAAREDRKPKKPIGLWVAYPTNVRSPSEPLTTVAHLAATKVNGMAVTTVTSECGYAVMVDKKRVTGDDFLGDDDLPQCGWCTKKAGGEEIPAYDKGSRRPVLPNMAEARQVTPEPVRQADLEPEVEALTDPFTFSRALVDLEDLLLSALPTERGGQAALLGEQDLEAACTRLKRLELAFGAVLARHDREIEQLNSRPAAASRTRNSARTPRPQSDGSGSALPDIRVGTRLTSTLFRTLDPIGPFLVGDGSKRWTVRDVRVTNGQDPDTVFGKDKGAAIAYATEQAAALSLEEMDKWAEVARSRMLAGDANRRAR